MVRRREKSLGCIRVFLDRRVPFPVSIDQGQYPIYEVSDNRAIIVVIVVLYEVMIVVGMEFLGNSKVGDHRCIARLACELANRYFQIPMLSESPAPLELRP